VIKGKEFDYWHFEPCDPEDLNWLERHYINAFRPILNRRLALVVIGAT
jgi:hypothetical protein